MNRKPVDNTENPSANPQPQPGPQPPPAGAAGAVGEKPLPNLTPEELALLLEREEQLGHIVRNPQPGDATPEQLLEQGSATLVSVAKGQASMDQVPEALGTVLDGTEKVLQVPETAVPAQGYRVQRLGLIGAGRCVLRLKKEFPIQCYSITPSADFGDKLVQVDAIHKTIVQLDATRDNMNNHVAPLEDEIYKEARHARDVLLPQAENNPKLAAAMGDLDGYLGGRYQKGNTTKVDNLKRDTAMAGEIRQEVEGQVRQQVAEDVARAVVQELGTDQPAKSPSVAHAPAPAAAPAAPRGAGANGHRARPAQGNGGLNAGGSPAGSRRQRQRGGRNRPGRRNGTPPKGK